MSTGELVAPTVTWNRRDWIAIGFLAAACLALRIGWLHHPVMNPDESQYEAHASYLVATSQSTFATPIAPVHANGLFKLFAQAWGPYEMFPIRMVVAGICLAMAFSMFIAVRGVLSRWYGFVSGLLFVGYNTYFEGLSANREWFAGLAVWIGMLLYCRWLLANGTRPLSWVAAAGLSCGLAIWIKDQAALLTLPIGCDLCYQAIVDRKLHTPLRAGAAYLSGLTIAAILYWIPFFIEGTAAEHWRFLIRLRVNYATGSLLHLSPVELLDLYVHQFYLDMPFRRLMLLPYALGLVNMCEILAAAWPRGAGLSRPTVPAWLRLAVFYLLGALIAIQTGSRFYTHYYLFLVPPVAVLYAAALWRLAFQTDRGTAALAALVTIAFFADLLWLGPAAMAPEYALSATLPLAVAVVAVFVVVALRARSHAHWGHVAPAVLCALVTGMGYLELGTLAADTAMHVRDPHHWYVDAFEFPQVVDYLRRHARHGDRLFVWGWRPEIYALSQLEAATQFATSMEVMHDTNELVLDAPTYDPESSARLMRDLTERQPRFIVDAWVHSIHGGLYRLEYYAPLRQLLQKRYRLAATLDECDIYELCAVGESPTPWPTPAERLVRAETMVTAALASHPDNVMLELTQADLWAQTGRSEDAARAYRALHARAPQWLLIRERLAAIAAPTLPGAILPAQCDD